MRGWINDGAAPETVAILVHDRFQRERVVNSLGERGVEVRAVDRESPPDRPAVMTMHRAKGMEFSKVVLAGIGASLSAKGTARLDAMDEAERADAELRERSLVYVATTRARDELVVVRRT